jgi:hypothetical protein
MDDRELHKLRRTDMLELMISLSEENEALRERMELQKEQLDDRTARLRDAEAIADVALKVNKIFEAAQDTADSYLESMRQLNEETQRDAENTLAEILQVYTSFEMDMQQNVERKYASLTKCLKYSAAAVVLVFTIVSGTISFRKSV